MPFFLGQKVVYIGPDYTGHPIKVRFKVNVPTPGEVYRIRSAELTWKGVPGYLLEGVENVVCCPTSGQEMIIDKAFLRPVIEAKEQGFWTTGAPTGTKRLDNRCKTTAWAELKRRIKRGQVPWRSHTSSS